MESYQACGANMALVGVSISQREDVKRKRPKVVMANHANVMCFANRFVILWIAGSNTEMFSSNAIMQLWLQSTGDYTVSQTNYIPTSVSGMGIVATLILGWYSDYGSRPRWHVGIFLSFTAIISGALFLSPPTRAARFAALILNGCQYAGQTVTFAWANDLTRDDDAKRSIVLASMNLFSVAVYLFWSILFYNTTQAPNWTEGCCKYTTDQTMFTWQNRADLDRGNDRNGYIPVHRHYRLPWAAGQAGEAPSNGKRATSARRPEVRRVKDCPDLYAPESPQ